MASKGTVHGHHDVVVGAEDVHVEVTVGAAHLTLAAVRFFNGLRGGGGDTTYIHQRLLVVGNLVVLTVDEEDGVLSSGVERGESLPEIDVFNHAHAVVYAFRTITDEYSASSTRRDPDRKQASWEEPWAEAASWAEAWA